MIRWNYQNLAAEQLLLKEKSVGSGSGRTGGTHSSSQYKSHLPGHFPLAKLGMAP